MRSVFAARNVRFAAESRLSLSSNRINRKDRPSLLHSALLCLFSVPLAQYTSYNLDRGRKLVEYVINLNVVSNFKSSSTGTLSKFNSRRKRDAS